jgi:hypothetical protein
MATIESGQRSWRAREAIKELKARYFYHIDEQDWEAFNELFTEDVYLNYGEELGEYEGQEGLEEFAAQIGGQMDTSSHMAANPIIDVDGDTATGRWYVDAREAFSNGQTGITQAEYRDEYRRVDGEWKFAKKRVQIQFHIRLEDDEVIHVRQKDESHLL